MKKARKLLVTLLLLTFVLSSFSVGFAADNDKPVSTTSAVDRAQALDILKGDDQGNLNLDKPITRAEALALIIRISGLEVSADLMKGPTTFADVNANPGLQWATGYINLGVSNNVVNGFPDGTFRGTNQVTYAEMAKMILYAMNYGVTVKGAPWPAGVMAKADDLKLFDKVAAAPNLPAIRGDVVQMIDNSLTVRHLVQKGWGGTEYYEEGDEDFLYKLRIDEIPKTGEGYYVQEIARVNSKLDSDEILLSNGNIYTLKTDVKPEEIFGKKVKVWVKRDDNKKYKDVFYVKVDTAEKDNLFDTIKKANVDDKKLELKIADKTYKIQVDKYGDVTAKLFVNYKEVDLEDFVDEDLKGLYGNFVLERGEIVFANLFEFDNSDKGLVTKVDKNIIEFVALEDAKDDELDLDDYKDKDIYVYDKNFNVLDKEDIKEDSLIYYWTNDDDEIFIVVDRNEVQGEVGRVRADKVQIDGKSYSQANAAIVSYDKGKNYEEWKELKDVEDFTEEKVIALLALDGNVAVIRGDAKETSGTIYGIVTYVKSERSGVLTLFTEDGKEVDYTAEVRSDLNHLRNLNYYGKTDEATDKLSYAIAGFKLNRDGEIAEEELKSVIVEGEKVEKDEVEKAILGKDQHEGRVDKKEDKTYFKLHGGEEFYISKSTVIMTAINKKELDPKVISYEDFVKMSISEDEDNGKSNAVVFGEEGKNAKLVVFLEDDFKGTKETYYFGIVQDDPWVGRRDTTAKIDVAGEGKKDYKIKDEKYFQKGYVVAFTLNSKNEAVAEVSAAVYGKTPTDKQKNVDKKVILVDGVVEKIDGSFVTIKNKDKCKFASDVVLYRYKLDGGKFKLDTSARMARIREGDYMILLFDEDDTRTVKAAALFFKEDILEFNK